MSNYKRTWADVQREHPAAVSSMKMLLERYEGASCDTRAVSTCVRCNIVFLARWTADLLETSRAMENGPQNARTEVQAEE